MARARMIKPEFFMHEDLAELSIPHRLLYIGLWTLADRAGRTEDRPKRIKASIFPWDDCDVDAMLSDLARAGFVVRYEVSGVRCIAIPSFGRHQKPHIREAPSILPVPPEHSLGSTQAQPRQCLAPAKAMSSRAESESESESESVSKSESESESGLRAWRADDHGDPEVQAVAAFVADLPPAPGSLGVLAEAWNEITTAPLPRVAEMPPARRKQVQAALKRRPLAEWRRVFEAVEASSFCRGVDGGWKAGFDWAIRPGGVKPEPAVGLLEGVYVRAGHAARAAPRRGVPVRAQDVDWTQPEVGDAPF